MIKPAAVYLPTFCRNVGEKTPSRFHLKEIEGTSRRAAWQAITWNGLSPNADFYARMLPKEEEFQALNPLSRKYLAFTVNMIKQMGAARNISPDTSATLFFMEWNGVQAERISHENYIQRRTDFLESLRESLNWRGAPKNLLGFEFWARAKEAGIRNIGKFPIWAPKVIFVRKKFKNLGEGVKQDYLKDVWIETNLQEDQLGIRGLNKRIGRIVILKDGAYFFKKRRTVGATISLRSREGIDTTMKAELGHRLFELLAFVSPWVEELADRMNIMFDSPEIFAQAFGNKKDEELAPQARTARNGAYLLSARMAMLGDETCAVPTAPETFPAERIPPRERHEIAEYVEIIIRMGMARAFKADQSEQREELRLYRQTGLYVCLLKLQGLKLNDILKKVYDLDIKEVRRYAREWRQIAIPRLEKLLHHPSLHKRGMAAKALIHLRHRPKDSPGHRRLYAYQLIDQGKYKQLLKLGKDALPALEALKKSSSQKLADYARGLIKEILKQKQRGKTDES